jgi:putative hydrolase of the HAD superfamily
MTLRAISFDLGHTLLFPRYDFYREIIGGAGVETSRTEIEEVEARLRPWFDGLVLEGGLDDSVWQVYYTRFFTDLGVPVTDLEKVLLNLLAEHRKDAGLWTEPAPDAVETLDRLAESPLLLACVSNNDGRLRRMVEHQGWQEYFDLLVDSEEVASTKPDPGIFHHALRELELEPDEIVHIGDYYSADVVGAQRAGIEGILYDPLDAYAGREVDCRVISTLLESVELLGE